MAKKRARSGRQIPDEEWRRILDDFLAGCSTQDIATEHQRSVEGVLHLINSKIPTNYDEDNARTPPVVKLSRVKSVLDPTRRVSSRDVRYFIRLRRYKRTEEECVVIMNLERSIIKALIRDYGGPKGNNPGFGLSK